MAAEAEFDSVCFLQIAGERGKRDARIDREFRGAPESAHEAVGLHGLGAGQHFGCIEPGAFITESRTDFGKLARHSRLIFAIDQVQRAFGAVRQPRGLQQFQPAGTAAESKLVERAMRLTDGPDHAEVAHGCSRRTETAFKDNYLQPPARRFIGVGPSENASAHNGEIGSAFSHFGSERPHGSAAGIQLKLSGASGAELS